MTAQTLAGAYMQSHSCLHVILGHHQRLPGSRLDCPNKPALFMAALILILKDQRSFTLKANRGTKEVRGDSQPG